MSYQDTVLPIIRQVRGIVLPDWGIAATIDKKSVNPSDVVTELDRKVEKFLSSKLSEIYPEIQFVGEEFGGNRDSNLFWLVDPIDGTAHYIRGLPFCTTMLALVENGQVIFSVIYDFVNDDLYWAEKGKGAYKNDIRIYVSDRDIQNAYICFETNMKKEENQKKLAGIIQEFSIVKTIAAGWELAMVASGKLDGRIGFDPWGKDYDYAPGLLLVREAGGMVTNIGSSEYDYRNTEHIAANHQVHKRLQEIFNS